ncbi:MAG: hypothetical protein ABJA62_05585 [Luteimonas sp.]
MSMQDHPNADGLSDDLAVARLFELSRNGDTENREFWELDSMVQERLLQAYGIAGALDYVTQTASA